MGYSLHRNGGDDDVNRRRAIIGSLNKSTGERLEYVESNGYQFVWEQNSALYLTGSSRLSLDFKMTGKPIAGSDFGLIGAHWGLYEHNPRFYIGTRNFGGFFVACVSNNGWQTSSGGYRKNLAGWDTNRHTATVSFNHFIWDGTESIGSAVSKPIPNNNRGYCIGTALKYNPSQTEPVYVNTIGKMLIYEAINEKFQDEVYIEVAQYIPWLDYNTGKAGLLDTINDIFHPSYKGDFGYKTLSGEYHAPVNPT